MERFRPPYLDQGSEHPIFVCSSIAEMIAQRDTFIEATQEWAEHDLTSLLLKFGYKALELDERIASRSRKTAYRNPGWVRVGIPAIRHYPEHDRDLPDGKITLSDPTGITIVDLPGKITLGIMNRKRASRGFPPLTRRDLRNLQWIGYVGLLNTYSSQGDQSSLYHMEEIYIQEREPVVLFEPRSSFAPTI